ncbi:MAG: 30S ribosomal protein S6 [Elusimicrobiota bacterium]
MPAYETVFAVPAVLSEEEQSQSIREVEELIREAGGNIVSSEQMGERKMAYIVKGHERAYYYLIKFDSPPEKIDGFKRHYRINSNRYIRNIIVKEEA